MTNDLLEASLLVRLTVQDVQTHWDLIKRGIAISMPPQAIDTDQFYTNVYDLLLTGKMHAWAGMQNGRPVALCITQILHEAYNEYKSLLVFVLAGFDAISDELWQSGFATLKNFAKAESCKKLVAYTEDAGVVRLARMHTNAHASYFLSLEV